MLDQTQVPASLFAKQADFAVVIDFDGTVTDIDVVDGLLVQFARTRDWIRYENDWTNGKISSDFCLAKQLGEVRVGQTELIDYLKTITIDPGFLPLVKYLREKHIPVVVLSDGFDLFIREIFRINQIKDVPFRSNVLDHEGQRLIPTFPYKDDSCRRCANCKRRTLLKYRSKVKHFVFIGDGLSDGCVIGAADTIFAKRGLADLCQKAHAPFQSYQTLTDVLKIFPSLIQLKSEESDERFVARF